MNQCDVRFCFAMPLNTFQAHAAVQSPSANPEKSIDEPRGLDFSVLVAIANRQLSQHHTQKRMSSHWRNWYTVHHLSWMVFSYGYIVQFIVILGDPKWTVFLSSYNGNCSFCLWGPIAFDCLYFLKIHLSDLFWVCPDSIWYREDLCIIAWRKPNFDVRHANGT